MSANALIDPKIQGGQSAAFKAAFGAAPQESLSEGIGAGYGVLSYKGKVWSLRYKGQNYIFNRQDDGTPSPYIDVIIVRQAKNKSKSYYAKYDPNSAGERPICSSLDGIVPDADAAQKQAPNCATCPRNAWYTNSEGRKTRDCTDYKRLAVLLMPDVTKRMLGTELHEPVFLRIPPASLTDLGTYGDMMEEMGYHYCSLVTRISFDPTQPHPKMVFKGISQLSDAEAPFVLAAREEGQTLRITGEDKVSSIRGAAPIPAQTVAQIEPPKAAGPLFTAPATTAPPSGATGVPQAAPQTIPAQQAAPVADADVSESDAELDAQINALLNA